MSAPSHLPPALAARLAEEQHHFGHNLTQGELDASLARANERHDHARHERAQVAHEHVQHAMNVATTHESRPEDNVPGRVLHADTDPLAAAVEAKKASVSQAQKELDEVNERLRRADEVEREIKAKLGLA
ncbi:hypothetical protein JCM10212_000318 [Sporobolomyces blumeae]